MQTSILSPFDQYQKTTTMFIRTQPYDAIETHSISDESVSVSSADDLHGQWMPERSIDAKPKKIPTESDDRDECWKSNNKDELSNALERLSLENNHEDKVLVGQEDQVVSTRKPFTASRDSFDEHHVVVYAAAADEDDIRAISGELEDEDGEVKEPSSVDPKGRGPVNGKPTKHGSQIPEEVLDSDTYNLHPAKFIRPSPPPPAGTGLFDFMHATTIASGQQFISPQNYHDPMLYPIPGTTPSSLPDQYSVGWNPRIQLGLLPQGNYPAYSNSQIGFPMQRNTVQFGQQRPYISNDRRMVFTDHQQEPHPTMWHPNYDHRFQGPEMPQQCNVDTRRKAPIPQSQPQSIYIHEQNKDPFIVHKEIVPDPFIVQGGPELNSSVTLISGVDEERLEDALDLIREEGILEMDKQKSKAFGPDETGHQTLTEANLLQDISRFVSAAGGSVAPCNGPIVHIEASTPDINFPDIYADVVNDSRGIFHIPTTAATISTSLGGSVDPNILLYPPSLSGSVVQCPSAGQGRGHPAVRSQSMAEKRGISETLRSSPSSCPNLENIHQVHRLSPIQGINEFYREEDNQSSCVDADERSHLSPAMIQIQSSISSSSNYAVTSAASANIPQKPSDLHFRYRAQKPSETNSSTSDEDSRFFDPPSVASSQISNSPPMCSPNDASHGDESEEEFRSKMAEAEKIAEAFQNLALIDQNNYGDTPLHVAMIDDDWHLAEAILKRLFRDELLQKVINVRNRLQQTPLALAVICNKPRIVEMLVENGADVNVHIKTSHDNLGTKFCQPLHLAATRGHLWKDTLRQLLKAENIELDAFNSDGKSALHCAIEGHGKKINDVTVDCKETLRLLAERGANLNQPDCGHETTPLHYAIERREVELVSRLLLLADKFSPDRDRCGISQMLEARTGNGNTALHLAASVEMNTQDHRKLITLLMSRGADPSGKNSDGFLPRELTKNREIVELLKGRTVSSRSPNLEKKRNS